MSKSKISYWTLISLLVLTGLYVHFLSSVEAVPLSQPLENFPTQIGPFQKMEEVSFSQGVVDFAGMDHYLMWNYEDRDGYPIGLYVGYYEFQSEGHIIHSPKHCMPGSGWEFSKEEKIAINNPANGQPVFIKRSILQKGLEKQVAHYWNQGRGRIIGNEYKDRAYLLLDSIFKRESQGALIRITGPANNLDEAFEKQEQFIDALLPVLNQFIPN